MTNLPELAHSLDPETKGVSRAEALYAQAETLLIHAGRTTTINSVPGIATPWSCEIIIGSQLYYARLGKLDNPDDEDNLPLFLFDTTPNRNVQTVDAFALRFKEYAGVPSLIAQNELDPLVDDPRYLKVAEEVIRGVAEKYDEYRQAEIAAKAARRNVIGRTIRHLRQYFNDKNYREGEFTHNVGDHRKVVAGSLALAGVLGYGHLVDGSVDAKIGPVPMPQPIELFVDLGNWPDHRAQGFSEPQGAADLRVGAQNTKLPILDTYRTSGVPDSTRSEGPTGALVHYEESRPGLYRVDLPSPTAKAGECVILAGDYRGGESSAFTQDVDIANNVRLNVQSAKELEVCTVEGATQPEGSFYIWQNK